MENISLLLSGEYSKGLSYISFNNDENWDVTVPFLKMLFMEMLGQMICEQLLLSKRQLF
jgi:hypothetical protein